MMLHRVSIIQAYRFFWPNRNTQQQVFSSCWHVTHFEEYRKYKTVKVCVKEEKMSVRRRAAQQIKITVVGSGTVGKTSLILVYANEGFPNPDDYEPTV